MASSEEKSSSRSGLGWFPKLILWVAVIGFGYVYLSSVDREGGGTTASAMLDSIAKLSPVSLSSLPGFSDKEESAAESIEVAQAAEAPKAEAAKPVAQTESAAFARALVSDKPVESAEAPKPAPQPPVSYASAALKAPTESASAPAPAEKPAQAPSAPTAPAPVEQPASAPIAAQPEPLSPPPAMPAPSERAPMTRMPANEWAAQREQQRAEMMAQYEAMRREADERMRQYWGQMREAMPMPMPAVPYAHPGYAPGYMPGYAPGYAPGVYGPPMR
ncbi:MAG: hypothetical protein MZV65_10010 [Chromatiales bacterium]|nr:hypothetical protein [Chromatiales bacterium]